MSTETHVEEGVLALIRSDQVHDAVAALAEAGIDQLIKDGFLRDVPILGGVLGLIRATGSVRDLLMAKKLGRFLLALQSVPVDERRRFDEALGSGSERRRVGEALLLLLDRLDDMRKPELVARLFRAFMSGEIDRKTFEHMATAVDRIRVAHLAELVTFYRGTGMTSGPVDLDVCQHLAFAALVRVGLRGNNGGLLGAEFVEFRIHYERNDLGERFVRIISPEAQAAAVDGR